MCFHKVTVLKTDINVLLLTLSTPLVGVLKDNSELNKDIISRTPLAEFAKSREISNVIALLLTENSSFLTCQALAVDGGWTIE
jgi:NAD(P)-dependent dehydrogenase (short-subunit alcohol dehydrogenase family)